MSANSNSIASCLGLSRTARWLRFPFERRPFWGVTFVGDVGDVGVFPFAGDVGIFPMSHGTNTGRSAQRTRYAPSSSRRSARRGRERRPPRRGPVAPSVWYRSLGGGSGVVGVSADAGSGGGAVQVATIVHWGGPPGLGGEQLHGRLQHLELELDGGWLLGAQGRSLGAAPSPVSSARERNRALQRRTRLRV